MVGNVQTTITLNPFRLGWQHSDGTAVNNYKNGTIAKLHFEMKEDFYGTTDIAVNAVSAQTIVDSVVTRPPAIKNAPLWINSSHERCV